MQGIITVMAQVCNGIKAEGSYFILMLAALYILYRVNEKKNQWYIYYILLTQILVVMNPVVVMILSKAFPVLASYTTFMLLTPVLMVIPFAVAELLEKAKDDKQGFVWLLVAAIVIGLSGNLFGLYTSDARGVSSTPEQREVIRQLEELQQEQPLLVVADESVLPFIRTDAPSVTVLYGRDLYQPGMDLGIVDMYSEELLGLYEAVKNPEDTIEDILAMADLYGCNAVVVKQFEDAPKKIGHFKQYFDSENYIVYAIQ